MGVKVTVKLITKQKLLKPYMYKKRLEHTVLAYYLEVEKLILILYLLLTFHISCLVIYSVKFHCVLLIKFLSPVSIFIIPDILVTNVITKLCLPIHGR